MMSDTTGQNLKILFSFEINLQRMALHATALSVWKRPDMQLKLKQLYYRIGQEIKKFPEVLMEEAIKKINRSFLPSILYSKLVEMVTDIGYKMNDWFRFIRSQRAFRDQSARQIYHKFFKDIYWTHYGTIDEVKILKHSWLNIPKVNLKEMYLMACCYCSEELINELWNKIPQKRKNFPNYFDCEYPNCELELVIYWNKVRENKVEEVWSNYMTSYARIYCINSATAQSLEVYLLRMSVDKGYVAAVKLFWDKLTEQERNQNIESCLASALTVFSLMKEEMSYSRDRYAEIIFFLMSFLNKEIKNNVFSKTFQFLEIERKYGYFKYIVDTCVNSSPWKEFFNLVFNEFEYILNADTYRYLMAVVRIKQKCDLWNRIPYQLKTSVAENTNFYPFLNSWDIANLKIILNDPSIIAVRHEIVKKMYYELIFCIKGNEDEKFCQFIDEILIPPNWEIDIQEVFKLVCRSILKGDVISADKLLSGFSKEVDNIKSLIDAEIFCYYFVIKDQCDLADEFLIWKLESSDRIINFKNDFHRKYFTEWYLTDLWKISKENVESAKNKSENFWFWLTREGKEHDFDIDFPCSNIIGYDHLDILEDFLRWRFVHDEIFQRMDNGAFKEQLPLMLEYLVKKGLFEVADKLCDWVFDDKDEMLDFIRTFLLSERGILSCKLYISKYSCPNIFEPPTKEEMKEKF